MIRLILSKSPAYHRVSRPFNNWCKTVLSCTAAAKGDFLRNPNGIVVVVDRGKTWGHLTVPVAYYIFTFGPSKSIRTRFIPLPSAPRPPRSALHIPRPAFLPSRSMVFCTEKYPFPPEAGKQLPLTS